MFSLLRILDAKRFKPPISTPPIYSLIAGGFDGTVILASTEKHLYANQAMVGGSALPGTMYTGASAGTNGMSIIMNAVLNGASSNATTKYSYPLETMSSGSVLGLARYYSNGIGNPTIGFFIGGYNGQLATVTNYTDRYTYATDTVVAGTVLSVKKRSVAGFGNSLSGRIIGGYGTAAILGNVDKYDYASDTYIPLTALNIVLCHAASFGNSTTGFYAGGITNTVDYPGANGNQCTQYTYANDSTGIGSNIGTGRNSACGTGNATVGVIAGGYNSQFVLTLNYVQEYSYVNNNISSLMSLTTARNYPIGVSPTGQL